MKDKKVCLRCVWIRLTTAYLLCAREFRQNNALAFQFWCLSNALTLRVCALDASKSQRACIILSKFTRKSKYAVINPNAAESYKIVQKLSPKHTARGVVQLPYPIYRHGKACLSKQPPWRAAGDPRLARSRSQARTFFSPPSLPSSFGR